MLRTLFRGFGELCITAGVVLLLFVTWQLWWTDVEANRTQSAITADLERAWHADEDPSAGLPGATPDAATVPPAGAVDPAVPPVAVAPAPGTPFAIIHIPRFGADYQPKPVLEGTSLDVLEKGVGHYPGTVMPGAVGNVSLAGHRVTYGRPFNQIAELQNGDAIILETADAWYIYRMRSSLVVQPDRLDVVSSVPEQPGAVPTERLLTLTACHPMYSARERFIVHAVLDRWQPKSAGEPAELTITSAG